MTELETLRAELAKRDALIAQMKEDSQRKLTLKVGESGTVCLYHGARYPVALYREQWERILPFIKSGAVERFIEANASVLSVKAKS